MEKTEKIETQALDYDRNFECRVIALDKAVSFAGNDTRGATTVVDIAHIFEAYLLGLKR